MITIFGSSTAYYTEPAEASYVHLLRKYGYQIRTRVMNGYTVWHANYMLPRMLTERSDSNTVILHVGACEAITQKATNFLELASYWLNYGEVDHFFMAYIAPKIYGASQKLNTGDQGYFNLLTDSEFGVLLGRVLKALEGYRTLVLGMSCPNKNTDILIPIAKKFDQVITDTCSRFSWCQKIDVFSLCADDVIDSNHLTPEGHSKVYKEIVKRLS